VPARSGDSLLKDNITVRQGDSAVLKCSVDSKVTRVAWLNRTTILFAGSEKWTLDPRVVLMENTPVSEYSIKILSVDVHDEGPYVCTILTNKKPKSTKVHLIVQVPARITNISQAVTVNEGSNVNLVCLALGRPEPSVVWKHHSVRAQLFAAHPSTTSNPPPSPPNPTSPPPPRRRYLNPACCRAARNEEKEGEENCGGGREGPPINVFLSPH
ncbi:unnamed protein product, partial [Boreogadus saida]